MKNILLIKVIFLSIFIGCSSPEKRTESQSEDYPMGKLFIIGGGKRPVEMIQELIDLSGLENGGYAVVLPMSSSEPDTSFYYAKKQFVSLGTEKVFNLNFKKGIEPNPSQIDSLINAKLIYISGGDQSKFMDIVLNTPIHESIKKAYENGSVIAGTSAGAAVMSQKMITGNEFKHPEYTGDFRTIEADNMELKEGLGLVENAIIDQHFIWRMRMNRLISVALENPGYTCIGIDESTAIVVEKDSARVTGISQVVVLYNSQDSIRSKNGLLGGDNVKLSVYLPGDKFPIK